MFCSFNHHNYLKNIFIQNFKHHKKMSNKCAMYTSSTQIVMYNCWLSEHETSSSVKNFICFYFLLIFTLLVSLTVSIQCYFYISTYRNTFHTSFFIRTSTVKESLLCFYFFWLEVFLNMFLLLSFFVSFSNELFIRKMGTKNI